MPYSPSQIDTSGQIRGRGIAAFGQSLAEGLSGAVDNYNKNKALTTQSTAKFEGAVNANPDLMKFLESDKAPADAAKAYAKLHKDGAVGLRDAAVLAQIADSYTAQKQQQQEAQMRQQQAALYQQQAAEFAQRIEMQKQAQIDSVKSRAALAQAAGASAPGPRGGNEVDPAVFAGSPFAGAMTGAQAPTPTGMPQMPTQQRQAQSFNEMARRLAGNPDAPLTPDIERFMNMGMQADDRAAAVDQRASMADSRAKAAEDKLASAEGEYKSAEEALVAGAKAIKAAGIPGVQPKVIAKANKTYAIEFDKPYAQHSDVAERAVGRLAEAEDTLALAQEHGTEAEISRAKKNVDFWKNRADLVSTRPPNAGATIALQLAGGAVPVVPAPAPAPAPTYATPQDLVAAVKTRKLTADEAKKIAQGKGWK